MNNLVIPPYDEWHIPKGFSLQDALQLSQREHLRPLLKGEVFDRLKACPFLRVATTPSRISRYEFGLMGNNEHFLYFAPKDTPFYWDQPDKQGIYTKFMRMIDSIPPSWDTITPFSFNPTEDKRLLLVGEFNDADGFFVPKDTPFYWANPELRKKYINEIYKLATASKDMKEHIKDVIDNLNGENISPERMKVVEWAMSKFPDRWVIDGHGVLRFKRDCCEEYDTGEYYHASEMVEVRHSNLNGPSRYYHEDSPAIIGGDGVFRCYITGEHYYGASYTFADEYGEFYEISEVATHHLFYWESDDAYHDCEEPTASNDRLSEYHDTPRPWRNLNTTNKLYGIEMEMRAHDDRMEIAQIAREYGFIAERDGSLDEDDGIEIIAPPMSYEDTLDPNGSWHKFLQRVRPLADGFRAGCGYGMHISINKRHLDKSHAARIIFFIHGNRGICETVAMRRNSSWCRFYDGMSYETASGTEYTDKHIAINSQGQSRMECRIFRSNISAIGFNRNVQFLDSIVEFTRDIEVNECNKENYLKFIEDNQERWNIIYEFFKEKGVITHPSTLATPQGELELVNDPNNL